MNVTARTAILYVLTKLIFVALLVSISGCASYSGIVREVRFESYDGVELVGSFVIPDSPGDEFPAILILHGAEAATRSFAYRLQANIFLDRGIAVLLYDKRGAGESEGDHDSAHYSDFIADAYAALEALLEQGEVNAEQLGLVGNSESGWFTPEIAHESGAFSMIINKVGPSLSWRETVGWEVYNELLKDGMSESEAHEQAHVYQKIWSYYVEPDSIKKAELDELLSFWSTKENSRLPEKVTLPSEGIVNDIAYDPAEFLEQLDIPMLYVYGELDVNIPSEQSAARILQLQKEGRPFQAFIFQGEGHELGGIGLRGYQFAKGYAEMLGEFAEKHLK